MQIDAYLKHIASGKDHQAVAHGDVVLSYSALYESAFLDRERLKMQGITNQCVLLSADYHINSISLLLALWAEGNVVALTSSKQDETRQQLAVSTGASAMLCFDDNAKSWSIAKVTPKEIPLNVMRLLEESEPGFIVFSSGSTGPAKGVVHRLAPFLSLYSQAKPCGNMLAFLLFDHIGGLATLFHTVGTHGSLVIPNERSPDEIGRCIDHYQVNTLHVSPTLLNLALVSGAFERWNINSLQNVYYGSEPISDMVLKRVEALLPEVALTQLYGMSEVGVLPCENKPGDSRWLTVNAAGFEVHVMDGICHVKAKTLMLGYLSGTSPLDENTLFNTGDLAESDGEYFRVKGRETNLINVGGTNICPTDVERVLEACDNVQDVVVFAEANPLIGEVVAARFVLKTPEKLDEFKARLYQTLKGKLLPEQIPRVITLSDKPLYSARFKKVR